LQIQGTGGSSGRPARTLYDDDIAAEQHLLQHGSLVLLQRGSLVGTAEHWIAAG